MPEDVSSVKAVMKTKSSHGPLSDMQKEKFQKNIDVSLSFFTPNLVLD